MPEVDVAALDHVETTLNYLDYTGERPAYYLYETEQGQVPPRPGADRQTVSVFDLRAIMDTVSLDENGFAAVRHSSSTSDFYNNGVIRTDYYPESEAIVKARTGAIRVHAFDHNVRNKPLSEQDGSGIREPVRFVHNDYTEKSGPQRVRDLMGDEAEDLVQCRFAFINVWRPLMQPVIDMPLAVCDAKSIEPSDFIATDLKYEDRTGEVYSVRHNPAHRWFYISQMRQDEVLLLKCFDSARDGRARYSAHTAFKDPGAPADAPARQSIEVRTIALFAS
ncbi:MAG: CmcJ/NvfI family oxidoreductase [Gammaproteobacteria bacterium]|nr:CmcJ/NvfI family oxidoreductase [Gammaproteobacteria bacterium]